nr:MAG TPA: hypothetical protein [Caudoviricetes sp.]
MAIRTARWQQNKGTVYTGYHAQSQRERSCHFHSL